VADDLAEHDRTFVLVAVVSALKDDRRTLAVAYHGKRNAQDAPGVIVTGIGKLVKADLFAAPVEIDVELAGKLSRVAVRQCANSLARGIVTPRSCSSGTRVRSAQSLQVRLISI